MPTSLELRNQRNKLVADARKVYELAENEKRAANAEERQQFDTMMAEVDRLGTEIDQLSRLETAERALEESAGRQAPPNPAGESRGAKGRGPAHGSEEYRAAFRSFIAGGFLGMNSNEVRTIDEVRSLQADNAIQAGFLVAPQQFVQDVILFIKNLVYIRQLAKTYTVKNAQSMGAPSLDADPADADWTSELNTGSEDSTMAFGKRELFPRPLAKRIKLSNRLLRMRPDSEALVLDRLAYKFAVTEEKAFMTGNGQNQPLGVFTASANGISTGRDTASVNAGVISADDLISTKYSLKQQYMLDKDLRWIWNRSVLATIRKLKDANGQYLWQPGGFGSNLSTPLMDMLLDIPVVMSEYAPSTVSTGNYVSVLGVLSHYWIADAELMTVQRLAELYAETNQTGFIGRMEVDGMPVLEEAFARLKIS